MILVIEGPNGAGKTTLAGEIIAAAGKPTRLIHNGPSEDPLRDYVRQGQQALEDHMKGTSTIIDRFNIGEQVYPTVFNRDKKIEPLEDHILTQALGGLGVRWVVLCPPVDFLIRAHRERGESFSVDQLKLERTLFVNYVQTLPSRLRHYFLLVVDTPMKERLSQVKKLVAEGAQEIDSKTGWPL